MVCIATFFVNLLGQVVLLVHAFVCKLETMTLARYFETKGPEGAYKGIVDSIQKCFYTKAFKMLVKFPV